MRMISLDDAHHCFQRCAWPDFVIRITVTVHLGFTYCEYTKNPRTVYHRGAIFAQDLNFFVHSGRLLAEIVYLCNRDSKIGSLLIFHGRISTSQAKASNI